VNVEGNPAGLEELRALGVPGVPAVALPDGRVVHGWNPPGYAALVGVEHRPTVKLSPAELAGRLDRILSLTSRLILALPPEALAYKPAKRDRDLLNLGFHVFRLALAFADGMDLGEFPYTWLQERVPEAPPDFKDGAAVARYGALVRGRLGGWFEGAADSEYARIIDVYYGPQSGHDLLERTTWHAAQHLRQLHVVATELGVALPDPLPVADFEGLPMPASLW
jgi:hypothetical protein